VVSEECEIELNLARIGVENGNGKIEMEISKLLL
jgi:hypothetical protein